ncbi:MAG TPA: alpha/beta fold hydrolase [Gaiellaceae bacterium]|nr:alpha/beta fold hydrolase [Gaiellaceae bacterium]
MTEAVQAVAPKSASDVWARLATEADLARSALAVVALHVADDNFLQPEPGTSPTDHLAGGLLPIALLAAAAYAYPRLRAGARGALALSVGTLAITIGVASGLYSTLAVGPSGDDFSGFLASAAGFALLAIGAFTLSRSRRREGSLLRRIVRRALLAAAALLVAYGLLAPIGLGYVSTHVLRPTVPTPDLGTGYENISFETSDGLRLEGWYIPSRNGAAVIAFPGRSGPQKHARMLAANGYGVLLFDRRGEGRSEGDSNIFGWGGARDIHAAVEFLQGRPDVEARRIGGIGFSVGGELMLEAAASNPDLAAVVSEGAGTRAFSDSMQDVHGLEKWVSAPGQAVLTASVAVFASTLPPKKLTDLVPEITQPLFLIWAPNGGNIETMNPEYLRLAGGPKQIWSIPDAQHVQGITAHPREYERRVVGFFDRELLDPN